MPAVATAPLLLALVERRGLRRACGRSRRSTGSLGGGAVLALVATRRARALAARRCSAPTGPRRRAHYTVERRPPLLRSTTSPSSTSTSACSRSPRCSRSGSRRATSTPGGAPSPPRRSRSSSGCSLEVAAFASQTSVDRIEERNMFYVAPLALIALVGLAADGVVAARRRPLADRRGRGRRAAGVHPVHALHHDERGLRHVRAAAVVVGAGPLDPPRTRCAGPRSPSSLAARGALRLAAAALRARPAGARRRVLRR